MNEVGQCTVSLIGLEVQSYVVGALNTQPVLSTGYKWERVFPEYYNEVGQSMFGQFNRFRGPIIRLKGIKYTELSRRMGHTWGRMSGFWRKLRSVHIIDNLKQRLY